MPYNAEMTGFAQANQWLRTLDFFPTLSEEDRARCVRSAKPVEAPKGAVIASPQETAEHAWVIGEGCVRLVRHMPEGRTLAVDLLGPGEIVGEMAILTGEPIPEGAEAMENVVLARLPISLLREFCGRNADLGFQLARRVGRRRMRIEARLADLAYASVPVRVARLLVQLSHRFGDGPPMQPRIAVRLTHQDIAELAGCSRETATRAIDQLMNRRIIGYEDGRIRIRSIRELYLSAEQPSPV